MGKLEFDDEGSRLVESINTVPDTIKRRHAIMRRLNLKNPPPEGVDLDQPLEGARLPCPRRRQGLCVIPYPTLTQ